MIADRATVCPDWTYKTTTTRNIRLQVQLLGIHERVEIVNKLPSNGFNMRLFDWLFGKEPAAPQTQSSPAQPDKKWGPERQRSSNEPQFQMDTCDVCSHPATANSNLYTPNKFKAAVKAGFRPDAQILAQLGTGFGASSADAEAVWYSNATTVPFDWLLCEACAARMPRTDDSSEPSIAPEPVAKISNDTMLGRRVGGFLQKVGWPDDLFYRHMAIVALSSHDDAQFPQDSPRVAQALRYVEWFVRQERERIGVEHPSVDRMHALLLKVHSRILGLKPSESKTNGDSQPRSITPTQ